MNLFTLNNLPIAATSHLWENLREEGLYGVQSERDASVTDSENSETKFIPSPVTIKAIVQDFLLAIF